VILTLNDVDKILLFQSIEVLFINFTRRTTYNKSWKNCYSVFYYRLSRSFSKLSVTTFFTNALNYDCIRRSDANIMPNSTSIVPANFNVTVQCPYFLDDNQRSSANIIPACTSVVPANANFTNYYQHTSCLYCSHRRTNNECSQLDTNVLFNANSMRQMNKPVQLAIENNPTSQVDVKGLF
jgi:hypothetical protein